MDNDERWKARLVAAYKRGDKVSDIVREFDTDGWKVYDVLKERKVPLRGRRRADLSSQDEELLVAAYRAGEPVADIIKISGHTERVLYRLLYEAGVPLRMEKRDEEEIAARDRAVAEAYRRGDKTQTIMRTYHVNGSDLARIAQAAGLPLRRQSTPERERAIVEAYERGDRVEDIRRQYNVSSKKMAKILEGAGVPPRDRKTGGGQRSPAKAGDSTERDRLVVEAYKGGARIAEIRDRFGVQGARLEQILDEAGVPFRDNAWQEKYRSRRL